MGSPGQVVAVDETLIINRHWCQADQDVLWVFGDVEHRSGNDFVEVLPPQEGGTSAFLI